MHTNPRSTITGKEKQVDSEIVADITDIALTTPTSKRNTIVLVTGDADIIPALEKVVKAERWKIEVYMWEHAIAVKLCEFASEHKDRAKIIPLDRWFNKVTFTSRQRKHLHLWSKTDEENGIVFSTTSYFDDQTSDKEWCKALEERCSVIEDIARRSFHFDWFPNTRCLAVSFCNNRDGTRFDPKEFLNNLQDTHYNALKVSSAQPFSEFKIEDEMDRAPDPDIPWAEVSSKKRNSVAKRCQFKFNCTFGIHCRYKHTKQEKADFQRRGGEGNPWRKVDECKYFKKGRCSKKNVCDYAHGKDDAWCLDCKSNGHFSNTNDCPYYN